jgi:Na+/H+ antiporter NhaD/arsenite permease-like protein
MTIAVFCFVYLGMLLGRIPGLALDRAGVAWVGAVALITSGSVSVEQAWRAVDVRTLALLFGLMIVSAQFRLGGFYTFVTLRLARARVSPRGFLALLILAAGGLSAVLANDIVCLAMTPILAQGCIRRGLDPVPYLLALACAANIGSAATLIGNPQNMLIGESLRLHFGRYLATAGPPALLGLAAEWAVIAWLYRGRLEKQAPVPEFEPQALSPWQTAKGLAVLLVMVGAFLWSPWPRENLALAGAGVLLLSRRMASSAMFHLVDFNLLLLFMGLFVVNHGLAASGVLGDIQAGLSRAGVDLAAPGWLWPVTVALSNLVSNVPAAMLLLPFAPAGDPHHFGAALALASTLAGNLLLIGSIANLIVVDQARAMGLAITWKAHFKVGVPVTLATLALGWAWMALA